MFRSIANWIDSPKGSKVQLILAKLLVIDVLLLDIILFTIVVAYFTGNYSFNTVDQELAVATVILFAIVSTGLAMFVNNFARNEYQKALQRARGKQ
jgi:hypothetical protein